MRGGWIVALVLLAPPPAAAGMMMFGLGKAPGAGSAYTPLCSVGPTCVYAYSTERQMVSTATTAFQVYRSVDATTQNVGFTSGGLVNTATVDAFCNAAVGGVISRNCFISEVFDQSGNACPIYNSIPADMPDYMVDPSHQGLPRFQKVWQGSAALTFLLDSNGGNTGTPSHLCSALTGGAQSLFFAGSSLYTAFSSGQFGLEENTPNSGPAGAMFAAFIGPPGYTYDKCVTSGGLNCGGLDTEAQGPQANYTRTADDDVIDIATTAGGTGPVNTWMNGVQITTAESVPSSLVTKARMVWGNSGDHSTPGPAIARSEAFFLVNLTSGQQAALYSNDTTFTAGLSLAYPGPGDLIGGETSYSTGLTSQKNLQLQWLSMAFSLRKAYAGYEGPALNACQGQGAVSCEDIGWVNNTVDTRTLSAFCGPVSGLNNCTVETWYNEALNQASDTNGVGTGIDATANSTSTRPTIAWSGCDTTAITVCIVTSPTNYFTTAAVSGTLTGGYTMSAVAQRTGGTTSLSAIFASVSTPTTFIGFAALANTCAGSASSGGTPSTVACNDNVVHSITVDAHTSPSTSTITYVDGTAGTTNTATIAYGNTGLGVGATGAGVDPCTCQISEFLLFADAHNNSFNATIGSSGVASLRANQRAVFGF